MISSSLHVTNENYFESKNHTFFILAYLQLKILNFSLFTCFSNSKNIALHIREFSDRLQYYIVFLLEKKLNRNRMPHIHLDTYIGRNVWIRRQIFSHFFFALRFCFSFMMNITREREGKESVEEGKFIFYVFRMLKIETQRDWLDPSVGFRISLTWWEDTSRRNICESRLEQRIFFAFLWNSCTKHFPSSLRSDHRTNIRRSLWG